MPPPLTGRSIEIAPAPASSPRPAIAGARGARLVGQDGNLESQRRVVVEVPGAEHGPLVGRDRRLGMLAEQALASDSPQLEGAADVGGRDDPDLGVEVGDLPPPVGELERALEFGGRIRLGRHQVRRVADR